MNKIGIACQQDLKTGDIAEVVTSPVSGSLGSSASATASNTPAAQSSGTTLPGSSTDSAIVDDEASPNTYRNIFFGLLFIGVAGAAFVWLRGHQWVRRLLSGKNRAQYRKVDEDDLEK